MRRAVLIGAVAFATLVLVLVVRTLGVRPTRSTSARAPQLELDRRMVSLRLSEALQLQTISSRDPDAYHLAQMEALVDLIEESYPRVLSSVEYERSEGSIVLRWEGSEPDLAPLLLLAHLDVVPVEPGTEEDWTWPPFSGEISTGLIWGRGALDDKSSALAMLEAVNVMIGEGRRPRRSVLLSFGFDEEIGGDGGARARAERFAAEGLEPFLVLDEGQAVLEGIVPGVSAPVGAVGVVEKGYATIRLSVAGEGGHASMPPRETPLGILGAALARLEERPLEAHYAGPASHFLESLASELPLAQRAAVANGWLFDPLLTRLLSRAPQTDALLRTTTAVTTASGGVAENVLPERAEATVNFRVHPSDSVAEVVEHAREVIDDERVEVELLPGAFEPSATSPTTGEPWWLLQRCIEECFEGAVVAPALVVGATDSRHYAGLGAPVYRFAPLRLESADVARLHGVDERISIEDYVAMIRFYVQLFQSS